MALPIIKAVDDLGSGSFTIHLASPLPPPACPPGGVVYDTSTNALLQWIPTCTSSPQAILVTATYDDGFGGPPAANTTVEFSVPPADPWAYLVAGSNFTNLTPNAIQIVAGAGPTVASFLLMFDEAVDVPGGLPDGVQLQMTVPGLYYRALGITATPPSDGPFAFGDRQNLGFGVVFFVAGRRLMPAKVAIELLATDGPPFLGLPRGLCHVGRVKTTLASPYDAVTVNIAAWCDFYFNGYKPRPRQWNVGFRVADGIALIPSSLFVIHSSF